jgi:glutamyl-tRNA reductase
VVLAAPDAVPGLRDLATTGEVTFLEERYDPALLEELQPFLVYAATDDVETNLAIVQDAADRGILASSVSCWEEGDFISPSVLQWGRGQVSITTEGASCRQAKFMRIRLEELLGGERQLLLVGVDRRALSMEAFEPIRPAAARQRELVAMLRHLAALEEFVLLATCNRLELYAWTHRDAGLEEAVRHMLGLEPVADRVYVKSGDEVVAHAANVVAGHFSEVVGETQITGQFKDAFRQAFEENVAGVHMQRLHDQVLKLGKTIRARQGAQAEGLPDRVAALVQDQVARAGHRVLVLGAGGLGREVAERLAAVPGLELSWGNRSAERMPAQPAVPRVALDEALADLGAYDQVVTVLGAAEPVVRIEHVRAAASPPAFIDLGVPRNVDPRIAARLGAPVFDLSHFRCTGADRERLVALAESVVREGEVRHA